MAGFVLFLEMAVLSFFLWWHVAESLFIYTNEPRVPGCVLSMFFWSCKEAKVSAWLEASFFKKTNNPATFFWHDWEHFLLFSLSLLLAGETGLRRQEENSTEGHDQLKTLRVNYVCYCTTTQFLPRSLQIDLVDQMAHQTLPQQISESWEAVCMCW